MDGRELADAAFNGCYEASRAAALSGVPKSTVYWWARQEIVVPSISSVQEKLWSYADLMGLRIVSWLRHRKFGEHGGQLPASPMPQVRRALMLLAQLDLDLWSPRERGASPLVVDRAGRIFVRAGDKLLDLRRHPVLLPEEALDLTAPFSVNGSRGPDLMRPRPHLRIVPSKVAGEPHLADSRVTTQAVAALGCRGWVVDDIALFYGVEQVQVREAIDLEEQLSGSAAA
jgi:uncharacterized protein (DUF433 family)